MKNTPVKDLSYINEPWCNQKPMKRDQDSADQVKTKCQHELLIYWYLSDGLLANRST